MLRSLLVVMTGLLPALVSPAAPVSAAAPASVPAAAPSRCGDPAVTTYGPSSLTAAIVGAAVHDGRAYLVSRGPKPPVLAELDLATRKVLRSVTLPDGPATGEPEGGWAVAVSGGKVYVGTYPVPDLYSFDIATGQVAHLHSFGAAGGFVWSLAAAPDGTLYAGTSSDGRVWEYVPGTGAVRRFGVLASGEHYVRAVAADDRYVYAGLLEKKLLMRIDRVSGAITQLATAGAAFGAVTVNGDRVVAVAGSELIDVRKDGSDLRRVTVGSGLLDAVTPVGDGSVYTASRPDGTVYRYRTGDTALTRVAAPPSYEDETRLLHVSGQDTLLAFAGSGALWELDTRAGTAAFTDLIDAGMPVGADRTQSMLVVPGRAVYRGGHFALDVRDLRTGEERRIRVTGEPKDLVRHGNKIYAAMYPTGEIISVDVRTDEVRSVGHLGHEQKRPWDIEYDPRSDKLLVATSSLSASVPGALSVVDPHTGEVDVYQNVIPGQNLMSLSLDEKKGVVYLAGDVFGTSAPTASIAAFDLRARTVLWQADPMPGHRTFQDVKVHDGLLYASYKRDSGAWIALDLATRQVVQQGRLSGYGELTVHRGRVFASVFREGGNAYELDAERGATLLATGMGDEWFTNPQLHFEPGSWNAWAIVGRDLARLRLDPRCPPLTIPAPGA
ncbi:PQQ-binding-like beta-propeller repeat protein [Nonomuraea sp. MCN248]|uniref:PQQ-binding-like beta-propeller repeat protein n=1 Tax=Nonomuraea corallina TaxID=2989783 RepID=A0ABT4S9M7_9ACTN|nr:PQQ-binding-like beta-propeller repeat protein [Nonomuraea corallina]MDA0633907.1 PQQ-binding-like beta-propeller repeat protein [Nonomuraea corallina]